MADLAPHRATSRRLTRTDPDPRVRHRADGLVLVAGGGIADPRGRGLRLRSAQPAPLD